MRAYMRDQFEYLGVANAGAARSGCAADSGRSSQQTPKELRAAAEGLWAMREREFLNMSRQSLLARYQAALSLDDLPWLLSTGAAEIVVGLQWTAW